MKRFLLLAAAMAVVLSACGEVVSLSSIVSPDRIFLDDGLPGRWRPAPGPDDDPQRDESFVLERTENSYEFRPAQDGEDPGFSIRLTLVDLDGQRFAELNYAPGSDKRVSDAMGTGLQVHRIHRYQRDGDRFILRAINFEHAKKLAAADALDIEFIRIEEGRVVDQLTPDVPDQPQKFQQIILAAPTDRLQKWLARHAADEDLWGDESIFERVPIAPATPRP